MRILCLVPTPLAAARAVRRLCDAQDGVLLGPAVQTPDALVAAILASSGDRRPVLPPLASALVAADAGRAAGGALADARPGTGLGAALGRSLEELRRAGVTAAEAERGVADLSGAAAERLRGLAAALAAYEARLDAVGALDRAAAAREAAAAVRRGAARDVRALDLLVVDGFAALAPAGWELLAALAARARRTRVHAPFFPDRPDVCAPAERLVRRLEALHDLGARREVELVLPRLDGRAAVPAALLAAFAGGAPAPAEGSAGPGGGRVLAVTGAGETGEADAIASLAARLVEEGIPPGEIAVFAPVPRRSAPLLGAAFAERGVPFSAGRGAALGDAPLVVALLDAVDAAAAGLGRAAVERIAAGGWLAPRDLPAAVGTLLDRAGALDGRVLPVEALRRRAAALASRAASAERAALTRAAGALDVLAGTLRPLSVPGTAREHASRLGALVERAGLRRRAARGAADLAARDLAALSRLGEAADELARAVALAGRGADRLAASQWADLLRLAVASAALPPVHDAAAGAVELWALDEAPATSARAAILCGCAAGTWPPPPAPEPLLRDPERIALDRRARAVRLATAASRRAEAVHRAFCAAAAGAEVIAFAWPAPGPAGDGGALAPLAAEALAAIGIAPPEAPAPAPPLARSRTAREALRAAACLARSGQGEPAAAALDAAGLGARARDAAARGEVEAERRDAVAARRASPHAGATGPAAASALAAALPGEWSPTDLETHARCPFRLFLQRAIRLADPAAADLEMDGRDEGRLLHAILERFVAARIARGAWPPAGDAADLAEGRAVCDEVLARFASEGRAGDPAVLAARAAAVRARVDRVVLAEARDHGGLVPTLLEHRFGGSSGRPPLALEADGDRVLLQGRVDRVDAGPDRLLVLDYKNARRGDAYAELLDPGAFGVTSFQVPTYALEAARALPGRRVEATYALLRRAERMASVPIAPEEGTGAPGGARGAGAAAGGGGSTFASSVVRAVRSIRRGEFPIASLDCAGCPFGAVCRFQGAAALRPGEAA